jgi:hypothetical protein
MQNIILFLIFLYLTNSLKINNHKTDLNNNINIKYCNNNKLDLNKLSILLNNNITIIELS